MIRSRDQSGVGIQLGAVGNLDLVRWVGVVGLILAGKSIRIQYVARSGLWLVEHIIQLDGALYWIIALDWMVVGVMAGI